MPTTIYKVKYYTIPEAAELFKVTAQTVRAWIKQGKLTGIRIGRPIYIPEESLKLFVANLLHP